MRDERFEKLAELLVQYSTKVKPGEKVFIGGEAVTRPLMSAIARKVIDAGASPELCVTFPEVTGHLLREGTDAQLLMEPAIMNALAHDADVYLHVWGNENLKANSLIDPARQSLYQKSRAASNQLMDEREENGNFRWCGTQYPGVAEAQEAGMSLEEYEDFVFSAGALHTMDPVAHWTAVSQGQMRWVRYLNTKKWLEYKAPSTEIRVCVEGRTWISCAGEVNFPDGEVFTSPCEDSMEGTVHFSYPAIYGGREVEGVTFEVEKGLVVRATARSGEAYLNAMLDTDEGARHFGEVAIGTNYSIQQFSKNILFDEKIGGTMHMAVGKSLPGTGGQNQSAIHWDFISDMNEGEIYADGELFYKNGRFLDECLEK